MTSHSSQVHKFIHYIEFPIFGFTKNETNTSAPHELIHIIHSYPEIKHRPEKWRPVHPSAKSAMSAAQALVSMATPFQVTERKRPQGERAREEQRDSFSETPNDQKNLCSVLRYSQSPACAGEESVFP